MKQARNSIASLTAAAFLAACHFQPQPNIASLSVSQTQAQVQASGGKNIHPHMLMDLTDKVKQLRPSSNYRGPIKITIDTALGRTDRKVLSQRRVLDLSPKHSSNEQHGKTNQDLYFDPENFPASVDAHHGDTPAPGSDAYIGTASINGLTEQTFTELIEVKFKETAQDKFDAFKQRYNVKVLSESGGGALLRLDLTKAKLSTLQASLQAYNSLVPLPITDISFSSIASAQTTSVILDLLMNHMEEIDYVVPVAVPVATFVNDEDRRPILTDRSLIDTDVEFIDSIEGGIRSSQIEWVKAVSLPQSRLFSDGREVDVAVIDTGFNLDKVRDIERHRLAYRKNYYWVDYWNPFDRDRESPEKEGEPSPDESKRLHGTFVTTVLAGAMDNGIGGVGVAPRANILQMRAVTQNEWSQAIYDAMNNGADVINFSQGYLLPPSSKRWLLGWLYYYRSKGHPLTLYNMFVWMNGSIANAIYDAYSRGIPVIAGAGNAEPGRAAQRIENFDSSNFFETGFTADIEKNHFIPASFEPVICVGGSAPAPGSTPGARQFSTKAPQSNYGSAVDIYAPGVLIEASTYGEDANARKTNLQGTSFATPIVAGVVALMRSMNSDMGIEDIKRRLTQQYSYTVTELGGRSVPVVDAFKAVKDINPTKRHPISQISGRLQNDGSGRPVFVKENGERVYLIPQYNVENPETRLTIAGWQDRANAGAFHVTAIREVPRPTYRVLGYVRDAVTGSSLSNVNVDLRSGIDACDGTVIATTQTDANGQYQFVNVDEGNYTVTISRTGFVRVCSNVAVNASNPTGTGQTNVATTTSLPENSTRFVLVWGDEPSDLDSHLTGPTANGVRFHIYYGNRSHSDSLGNATLDHDVTSGSGPETVTNTITTSQPGIYRYAIHDYTNRSSTSSTALSNSGAAVLVFRGDRLLTTIRPPVGAPGTVWNVLEMDGASGTITPVNRMGFESNPSFVIQGIPRFAEEFNRLLRGLPPKR